MITTIPSPAATAFVVHRVRGEIDEPEAAAGASEALEMVQRVAAQQGQLALLLDLRGMAFASLVAHRAWSVGFARNPALGAFVRQVAIVADDTPAFRAEQALLQSDRAQFFVDVAEAEQWLAQTERVDSGGRERIGALITFLNRPVSDASTSPAMGCAARGGWVGRGSRPTESMPLHTTLAELAGNDAIRPAYLDLGSRQEKRGRSGQLDVDLGTGPTTIR